MTRPEDAPAIDAPAPDPTDVLDTTLAGNRVIRGGALRTLAYAGGIVCGIASASLMIRHLGVVDFGRYAVVVSLVSLVGGISEAGLTNIAVREFSVRRGADRDRFMQNVLGIRLAVTLLGLVAAVIFALVAGYANVMVVGVVVFGAALLATVAQQTLSTPLASGLRFVWISLLELTRQVGSVVAVLLLVLASARLLPFLAAPAAVGVVILVLTVPLVRGRIPLVPALDRAAAREIVKAAFAYSAASAVGTIYLFTPLIVTSLVGSKHTTGYFGASLRVFQVAAAVPLLLVSTAFPVLARAARDDRERLAFAVGRMTEVALILGAWMALTAYLGAGLAIRLVAGSKFAPAEVVLQIQGLALLGSFLAVTWGFALLSIGRHAVLLVANGIALVLSVALTLALVPSLGAKGAAIATVISDVALGVAYAVVLLGRERLRPSAGTLPRVALAVALAVPLAFVPGLPDAVVVVAGTVVYFAVLLLTRGIPDELRAAFAEVLPGRGG